MDHRGNMSSQHRRTKVNHSLIVGPELTEPQQRIAKSRKKLANMTVDELTTWLEVCKLNAEFWKNRRSHRHQWQETAEKVEKQLRKASVAQADRASG